MSNRIPYQTILAAKVGNSEAMSKILRHYAPYIRYWAKGDDWLYQEVQVKLLYAINMFNVVL